MSPPADYPITGLCIVSDPEKCPPGYELIYRSHDRRDDCDLWKDGFFSSKVTRYLCITRVHPLEGGRLNNVLGDIALINEREMPYPGFTLIDKTVDSSEQATKKKVVSVKMLPRDITSDAIVDLIILSKSKRAPVNYTLVGEINGLLLCYKMGKVPPETQNVEQAESQQSTATSNSTHNNSMNDIGQRPSFDRQESLVGGHALHDVPFVLGPKYQGLLNTQEFTAPTINFKSLSEIEAEYNYPFHLERQLLPHS